MSEPERLLVRCEDGATSEQRIFAGPDRSAPVLVIFPAMGVLARFYDRLAVALNGVGLNVAIAEWRGLGTSNVRARRGVDFGYWTFLRHDIPAHLAAAQAQFPQARLYYLGHSLGGQVGTLYLGLQTVPIAGFIVIATGSIHWRGWSGLGGLSVLTFTLLSRAVAEVLGHYPGEQMRFGGREARGVIQDWSYASVTGHFRPAGAPFDLEARLAEVTTPVLAISIDGDRWAPPRALDGLMQKLPKAPITRLHHAPQPKLEGHPHFAWAKNPGPLPQTIRAFVTAGPNSSPSDAA